MGLTESTHARKLRTTPISRSSPKRDSPKGTRQHTHGFLVGVQHISNITSLQVLISDRRREASSLSEKPWLGNQSAVV